MSYEIRTLATTSKGIEIIEDKIEKWQKTTNLLKQKRYQKLNLQNFKLSWIPLLNLVR